MPSLTRKLLAAESANEMLTSTGGASSYEPFARLVSAELLIFHSKFCEQLSLRVGFVRLHGFLHRHAVNTLGAPPLLGCRQDSCAQRCMVQACNEQ